MCHGGGMHSADVGIGTGCVQLMGLMNMDGRLGF